MLSQTMTVKNVNIKYSFNQKTKHFCFNGTHMYELSFIGVNQNFHFLRQFNVKKLYQAALEMINIYYKIN